MDIAWGLAYSLYDKLLERESRLFKKRWLEQAIHLLPNPIYFVSDKWTNQSRNWDGGMQEFNTAASCVRDIFPDSELIVNMTDNYPIRIIVSAELDGKKKMDIWSGRQQELFGKNRSKRTKAIAEIKSNLQKLKSSL